jgi:hypothetical protein
VTRHSILFSFLGAGVLALATFNGCGGDEKAAEPDKYPGLGQFCNAIAEVECNQDVVDNCSLPDKVTCISAVQGDCSEGKSDLTKNFDTSRYNPKQAEPCIAKIKEAFGDAKLTADELNGVEDACAPTFSLNAAAGFQCKRDADCADGNLKCFFTAPDVGTCQAVVNVSGGSNCSAAGSLCPETQFCFSSVDAGQICKDKQKAGEKCAPVTQPCDPSNYCQTTTDETGASSSTCVAKFAAGDTCTTDDQCATGKCGIVNTSSGQVGKCITNVIFSASEAYCDNFRPLARPRTHDAFPGSRGEEATETEAISRGWSCLGFVLWGRDEKNGVRRSVQPRCCCSRVGP